MREFFRTFAHRVAALFRRRHLEDDLDAEMRSHLELSVEQNLRKGMSADEARREALRSFGGVDQIKELYRDQRGLPMIETALQDLRFGFRMLRRSPGVSLLAILCLTLGIGSNAAVSSWIEGILLRPYPLVAHQERMMAITGTSRGGLGADNSRTEVSWPDFVDLQRNCKLFDWFIVDRITGTTLSIGDRAQVATGSIVSSNYFDAIGVRPFLGRGFLPEEDYGRNAHPVTVISYQMWKDRFHGDPQIIGKIQLMNGMPHTIVGVAPEGFYGTFVGWAMQFWVPASMQELFDSSQPGYKLEDRGARWIEGFARLKPGVSPEQAQQEVSAIAKRLELDYPETNRGQGLKLYRLWQTPFNNAGALLPTLGIAAAVVGFVLLIVCANVSNLLLVRAFGRRHEMTVRLAVGARRSRLVRQLVTEGLILATLAMAGGLVVAHWCRNLLVLLLPRPGMHLPGELDWRVLAVTSGLCLLATLLIATVPAMQASKIDLAPALKAESGGVVGGQRKLTMRAGLVLVQVALSFVLLVATGLLLRSLRQMLETDPGFSTLGVLLTALDFTGAGYDAQRIKNFEDQLTDRLQAVPGIASVVFARKIPFSYRGYSSAPISVDGYKAAPDELPTVNYNEVGPGYLATTGVPLLAGREFSREDNETAAPVAIVNETMAAKYWRGQNPVGSRVQVKGRWMRVVGIAKTTKYNSLRETPQPFFYVPMRQTVMGQTLTIRTSLDPRTVSQALIREVRALDANLAPSELSTMQEQIARTTGSQRVAVMMLAAFGTLAVFLAAIGLYGVMSYLVSQRTREMGLRMALGATPSHLLRLVMSHGLTLTAGGIVLGAVLALGSTRLLGYLLYRLSPRDPVAFGLAFLVMTVVSAIACFLPAWRAARIDPIRALRD
jgi:macrolide transport system ATP-binding/permease protein